MADEGIEGAVSRRIVSWESGLLEANVWRGFPNRVGYVVWQARRDNAIATKKHKKSFCCSRPL